MRHAQRLLCILVTVCANDHRFTFIRNFALWNSERNALYCDWLTVAIATEYSHYYYYLYSIRNSAVHFLFNNWNFAVKLFIMLATPVNHPTQCRLFFSHSLALTPPYVCVCGLCAGKLSRQNQHEFQIIIAMNLLLFWICTFFTSSNRSHDQNRFFFLFLFTLLRSILTFDDFRHLANHCDWCRIQPET